MSEHVKRDPSVVSYTMSRIRGKDTTIELKLRKALHGLGFSYRCNSPSAFGHPDLLNKRLRIAIFADSEFWHGKNFEQARRNLKTNESFWVDKIQRNMRRDAEVNETLKKQGYKVLRYWGDEINKDLDRVVNEIRSEIDKAEKREEKRNEGLIQTTLIYCMKGDKVLMLNRNKKANDMNGGKWIGVGGHFEKGENMHSCVSREVFEETGLRLAKKEYLGQIDFLNSEYHAERLYLFRGELEEGEMKSCDEGTLEWVEKGKVLDLPLWEGDRTFLPFIFKEEKPWKMDLIYDGDALVESIGPYWPAKRVTKKKRKR